MANSNHSNTAEDVKAQVAALIAKAQKEIDRLEKMAAENADANNSAVQAYRRTARR